MKILAISVGQPVSVQWQGQEVKTSTYKKPYCSSESIAIQDVNGKADRW